MNLNYFLILFFNFLFSIFIIYFFLFFKVIFSKFKCFIILYTYFKKLNKIKYIIFLYTEVDFRNILWLPEVDFQWWFLTFRSRLPVMIFDFQKSTFGDDFWFSEVDFRWYILTFESHIFWLPKVYIILGVWCLRSLLNGQRSYRNLKKVWKCRRNFGGAGRKTPFVVQSSMHFFFWLCSHSILVFFFWAWL